MTRGALAVQVAIGVTMIASSCRPTQDDLTDILVNARFVDLTHAFDSTTVFWPTEEGFILEPGFSGVTDAGFYYSANSFRSAEHGGTHLDAPIHFAEGKWTSDEVPLASLVAKAVVVDVSEQSLANPDYQVSVDDLAGWEKVHGQIPRGSILLINTGFSQFWPNRLRYMGTDRRGAEAVAELHFPGLEPGAATWLVDNRDVRAVGIDTPSIDYGMSSLFETHQILFEENIPAFENVANPGALPPTGAWVFALPMKIAGGSGGPLRIIGVIPDGG